MEAAAFQRDYLTRASACSSDERPRALKKPGAPAISSKRGSASRKREVERSSSKSAQMNQRRGGKNGRAAVTAAAAMEQVDVSEEEAVLTANSEFEGIGTCGTDGHVRGTGDKDGTGGLVSQRSRDVVKAACCVDKMEAVRVLGRKVSETQAIVAEGEMAVAATSTDSARALVPAPAEVRNGGAHIRPVMSQLCGWRRRRTRVRAHAP
eukprot:1092850-Pleurochrysis_carterae.AAC.1